MQVYRQLRHLTSDQQILVYNRCSHDHCMLMGIRQQWEFQNNIKSYWWLGCISKIKVVDTIFGKDLLLLLSIKQCWMKELRKMAITPKKSTETSIYSRSMMLVSSMDYTEEKTKSIQSASLVCLLFQQQPMMTLFAAT